MDMAEVKPVVKELPTLAHALHKTFLIHASKPFVGEKDSRGNFKFFSYSQIFQETLRLADSFATLLPTPSDARLIVGIMADNSKEWLLTDFACCFNDYITVGLHTSWTSDTVNFVIDHSQLNVIVCAASEVHKVTEVHHPLMKAVIIIGELPAADSLFTQWANENRILCCNFDSLIAFRTEEPTTRTGAGLELPSWFGLWQSGTNPNDENELFTLLYTSGTTGNPKGVAVTKKRWLMDADSNKFPGQSSPTVISYMSLAHGGDRGICWQACFSGARVGISQSVTTLNLLRDMEAVRPTFLLCMSHLWAEFHALFKLELESKTIERLSTESLRLILPSNTSCDRKLSQTDMMYLRNLHHWQQFVDAASDILGIKSLLVADWFERFGGRVLIPVTGGGFTSDEVLRWMEEIFVPPTSLGKAQSSRVKNSYGSSEFPGISQNGEINENVDLELVPVPEFDTEEDGKLVRRGERFDPSSANEGQPQSGQIRVRHRDTKVKMEYWRNPAATEAAFRNGWYYTGDVGELDPRKRGEDGRPTLRIVDRVATMLELYVKGDSVWLEQSALEVALGSSRAVQALCLIADRNEDRAIAVVVPRAAYLLERMSELDQDQWIKHWQGEDLTYSGLEECALLLDSDALADELRSRLLRVLVSLPGMQAALLSDMIIAADAHYQAARGRALKPYERPGAVILEVDRWTMRNAFLTPTGKPRREKIREKFVPSMEEAYAKIRSTAATPEVDKVEPVSSAENMRMRTVRVVFPSVLEIDVSLPESLAYALEFEAGLVGPALAATSGKPLGWGGYILQNETDLPLYPNSTRKDYIGFRIEGPTEKHTAELNELLDIMAREAMRRREKSSEWSAQSKEQLDLALSKAAAVLASHTMECERALAQFSFDVEKLMSRQTPADDTIEFVLPTVDEQMIQPLLAALTRRLVAVRIAYEDVAAVSECEEKLQSFRAYRTASDKLRVLAPRYGVKIPFMIECGGWFNANAASDDLVREVEQATANEALSVTSLGDAKVWCSISGELIENDIHSSGSSRWHCLDLSGVDRSSHSHAMAQDIIAAVKKLRDAKIPGVEAIVRLVHRAYPLNPASLTEEEMFSQVNCVWVKETAHFWHLRDGCESPLVRKNGDWGPWESTDTPATFINRAFINYKERLALGIPSRDILFDPSWPDIQFAECALVNSAGMQLIRDRSYWWLTYHQLGELVMRTAHFIRSLVPEGAFVGICGYNGIEWAVCDLACAIAGCVSVGLHTTYDTQSALNAIKKTKISLLFCNSDIVWSRSSDATTLKGTDESAFWSAESVLVAEAEQQSSKDVSSAFPIKHIVVMDKSCSQIVEYGGDRVVIGVELLSLVDACAQDGGGGLAAAAAAADGEASRRRIPDDRNAVFTILFTSGSAGHPKGVVVTASSFFNDVRSRNYVEPLVTVSYIPLSHSSDRLKMWEFLGNGGRIGFAHYSPTNWLDHERTKKSETVQSSGTGSNDVEGLFRQITHLEPTAMACPPNIWNGIFHLYRQELKRQAATEGVSEGEAVRAAGAVVTSMFGPRIKFLVTGGGPTSLEVIAFVKSVFSAASFADSYGTTECGAISSNGKPIREKKVRLKLGPVDGVVAEDCGELWVSSPNMSSGYYKDEARTQESFVRDGTDSFGEDIIWYKTGDLVRLRDLEDRFALDGELFWNPSITVMGRIAASVKLRTGALVSPDALEATYSVSPLLSQMFIHGTPNSRALVAIVVNSTNLVDASENARSADAVALSVDGLSLKDGSPSLSDHDSHQASLIRAALGEINRVAAANGLQLCDIPKAVYIELEAWTAENLMLNSSFKKQRGNILNRYESVLTALHEPFSN